MKPFLSTCAVALLAWSTLAVAQDAKPVRKNDPKAIRCVRLPVTGTLAQVRKVCKTNDEWRRAREDAERVNLHICAGSNCAGS